MPDIFISYARDHSPRFLIVTNLRQLLALDTKTQDTLDIPLVDLPRYFDFFLPGRGWRKPSSRVKTRQM